MEPAATPFLVGRDPPPPTETAHIGEGQAPAPSGWICRAFQQTLIFLLACAFAWGLRLAGCDLGFAVFTVYLLAMLCFCLWKLELLRRDHGGDPVETARERRRAGLAAWALLLALGSTVALQVALHVVSPVQSRALRVALWVLADIAMGTAFYFLFGAHRSYAGADDDGHRPEKDLHEQSPEQRV